MVTKIYTLFKRINARTPRFFPFDPHAGRTVFKLAVLIPRTKLCSKQPFWPPIVSLNASSRKGKS